MIGSTFGLDGGLANKPRSAAMRRWMLAAALIAGPVWAGVAAGADSAASLGDASGGATTAGSSAPAADQVNEILVTAERYATPLEKTPIAVGVISDADVATKAIKNLWDTNGSVAGLYLPSYPSNMMSLSIRGIGTADPGVFSAVAYYLDDVYLGRTFGRGPIDLPDVERIEVLRGPQGTLYGQNTSGGAVKVISRDPTDSPIAWASASVGDYGASEAHGYFNDAIVSDLVSASLAYSHRQNDGDTLNAYRHVEVDRLFVDQIRAKLRLTPTAALNVVLAVDATHDESDDYIPTPNNGPSNGAPRVVYANTDTQAHIQDLGETLKVSYQLNDDVTLKSVSAQRRSDSNPHPWDNDGLPQDLYGWNQHFIETVDSEEVTLEGKFSQLTLTAGADYYHETFDFDRLQWLAIHYTDLESHVKFDSAAAFTQAHYSLTDALGVTLGVRFNDEHQRFRAASYRSDVSRDRLDTNYDVSGLFQNTTSTTPKFGIDYQISPNVFSYASATSGEKSGGFNRAAGTLQVASVPVEPEHVKAYEIGLKSYAWQQRITANLAVFYNKYDDYQASVTNPAINGQIIAGNVIVNAGRAHTEGAELETTFKPAASLDLSFTAAYLNTRFDEFVNPTGAANADYTGNSVPNAPRWSGSTAVGYVLPLPTAGPLRVHAAVNYIESNFTDIANTPILRTSGQTYLNGGLDYAPDGHHWSLHGIVKNALNRTYVLGRSIVPSLDTNTSTYNPPRTYLITARYDFQ
jgi:iron complex outermembrane receptor protein